MLPDAVVVLPNVYLTTIMSIIKKDERFTAIYSTIKRNSKNKSKQYIEKMSIKCSIILRAEDILEKSQGLKERYPTALEKFEPEKRWKLMNEIAGI